MHIVDVQLGRCACIHSLSQIVDILLQVLLYQRRIIPMPVQNLLNDTCQKSYKFKAAYQEITDVIRSVFCYCNRFHLHEFLIIIGATPYLPKEMYRIPICACTKHNNKNEYGDENQTPQNGCGDHCQALSHKEKRHIFSSITLNKDANNFFSNRQTLSTDKVFFFIKSDKSSNIFININGIEEDESFELPTVETIERRKIQQMDLTIQTMCHENLTSTIYQNPKWFRITQFIGHFM